MLNDFQFPGNKVKLLNGLDFPKKSKEVAFRLEECIEMNFKVVRFSIINYSLTLAWNMYALIVILGTKSKWYMGSRKVHTCTANK